MPSEKRWLPEEVLYLQDISKLCQDLSGKFKRYYELYKTRQGKFKIPAIIISSITGLTSFGTSNFPDKYQKWVSIGVGGASIFIALLNSIESYMKIGETMSGCLQASLSLQKLKEYIDIELALPAEDRSSDGIDFIRDIFSKYEKIIDLSPSIIKNIKYIRPSFAENINTTVTVRNMDQNSNDIEKAEVTISEMVVDEDKIEISPAQPNTSKKNAKTIFFA